MKNYRIFAAFPQETNILNLFGSSYFYGYTNAALSKDIRLSIHNGLLPTGCNLFLAECGKIAFPLLNTLIFHYMQETMKEDESSAKHSNAALTLVHETDSKILNFSQSNFDHLKKWLIPYSELDPPLIAYDISTITETQSLILREWDFLSTPTNQEKVKQLLIGLEYVKEHMEDISIRED